MNRFASFDFSDAEGINALVDKFPLAGGTNVFTSEGKLIVQYQDGEDVSHAVKIVNFKEQIRTFEVSKEEILHSQKVLDTLIADAKSRVEVAQAEITRLEDAVDAATGKAKEPLKSDLQFALKTLQECRSALHEVLNAKLKNEHEVARIDLNIELFNEKIAALSK